MVSSHQPITACRVLGQDCENKANRCQIISMTLSQGGRANFECCVYKLQQTNPTHSAFTGFIRTGQTQADSKGLQLEVAVLNTHLPSACAILSTLATWQPHTRAHTRTHTTAHTNTNTHHLNSTAAKKDAASPARALAGEWGQSSWVSLHKEPWNLSPEHTSFPTPTSLSEKSAPTVVQALIQTGYGQVMGGKNSYFSNKLLKRIRGYLFVTSSLVLCLCLDQKAEKLHYCDSDSDKL